MEKVGLGSEGVGSSVGWRACVGQGPWERLVEGPCQELTGYGLFLVADGREEFACQLDDCVGNVGRTCLDITIRKELLELLELLVIVDIMFEPLVPHAQFPEMDLDTGGGVVF